MKRLVLVALAVFALGCVNPNANNPAKYDACDFVRHMDLTTLGLADCDSWRHEGDADA